MKTKPPLEDDKRFMTHVALRAGPREELVEMLNDSLATAVDLHTQVKQAHWNIKGPQFVSRHLMFDDLASHLRGWIDDLAERISTLGGSAYGTARCAAERTKITEYNLDAVDGKTHIQALVIAYSAFTQLVREQLAGAGDPVTEDVMIEVLRGAEKDMWFLESHLNV
jgi:starvation-inducible DNA-binding protein